MGPKFVLALPIRDAAARDGCAEVEDLIDAIVVRDGSDDSRFVATTTHPGEPLEQVIEFAAIWAGGGEHAVRVVRI